MESNTVSTGEDHARDAPRGRPTSLADESALDDFLADTDAALVEFYTEGCGICASMEPVLGNVARTVDVDVALVNPRDDPPLVERFDVRSVPLFVLFVDGEPVARRAEGFIPGDDLTAWVREVVE
ncbi:MULTISPECIES: thioredoxin family protein [Haloferacaceae]|uniref:Thioredoxin family protein n=1 Tax=Halorubrum glutamatedens TaxID=2707018 RepID=A0ABD5QMZ0_9EURY|nr:MULTISPECIES: thioredoxin family protein [Haloferacales]